MSRFLGSGALVLLVVTAALNATADTCGEAALDALRQAAARVDVGDEAGALAVLRAQYGDEACRGVVVAAWALRGWITAQAAADRGGTPVSLADTTAALDTLATLGPGVSEAGYAAALLHAAVAAAQDERDELRLWLEQARDVSRRLATGAAAPRWPSPIDRAEGDLWHRVDDFELAETAFTAAVAADDTVASWRGLARARDRRGNRSGACAAFRTVAARAPAGSTARVEARGYLLLCAP